MEFSYNFSCVKGVQAGNVYYIAMVPCRLLGKLFVTEDDAVLPEFRAQRKLNITRIPEIKKYILENRKTYVFSALSASINGKVYFESFENENIGVLKIDMNALLLINDGQHRKAALEDAIVEDPTIGDEYISIVFFEDKGLERSQQMFTDLNKHSVNTSKSLNALYDYRNPLAVFTKSLVENIEFFKLYTDKEKDTLGKFSQKLFTLNNFLLSNERVFNGIELNERNQKSVVLYWKQLANEITEWNDLKNKNITKQNLRTNYIITQGVVLLAFGKLGNYFIRNNISFPNEYIKRIGKINWQRDNLIWQGRTLRDGRIDKSDRSITLTYIKIKELIGLELTEIEILKNNSVFQEV
jgi:DNA sulfur modification protein DndB